MKSCLGLMFSLVLAVFVVGGGIFLWYLSDSTEFSRNAKTSPTLSAIPPKALPVRPPVATPVRPPVATPVRPPVATPVRPPAAAPALPPVASPVKPPSNR